MERQINTPYRWKSLVQLEVGQYASTAQSLHLRSYCALHKKWLRLSQPFLFVVISLGGEETSPMRAILLHQQGHGRYYVFSVQP